MDQMTGLDASFLYGETRKQAMNLTGIAIYDPATRPNGKTPDHEEIVRYGQERVKRSPLFRRKVDFFPFKTNFPHWIDDPDFNVENHINRVALPAPGNQAQLDEEIAKIHASIIDRDHPLWEWWIVEGVDAIEGIPKGSFALMFKLHHAAFDGKAAWEVINISHDLEATEGDLSWNDGAVDIAPAKVEPISKKELAFNAGRKYAKAPFSFAKSLKGMAPILKELLNREVEDFPFHSPKAPKLEFNHALSERRVHRSLDLPIAWLKDVRQVSPGATLNDVTLCILGGALRRYLAHHNELPEASLIVGVPIAIRSEDNKHKGGNEAILSMLPLATDVADPIQRLAMIKDRTEAKKSFTKDIPANHMLELADYMPGLLTALGAQAFTGLGVADRTQPPFNFICTNVPASKVPLYFAGARMVSYDAAGPLWDGAGLIHVVTSYMDDLRISFDADQKRLPDGDFYIECIKHSIEDLAASADKEPPWGK